MKLETIGNILDGARLTFLNISSDTKVAELLVQYDFPVSRMQEGRKLYRIVDEFQKAKLSFENIHGQIADQLELEIRDLRPLYREHIGLARFIFRNDRAMLHALDFSNADSQKWQWIKQAEDFYLKIEAKTHQMIAHGITNDELSRAKVRVLAIAGLIEDSRQRKGREEVFTEILDHHARLLREWISEFKEAASLAFHNCPQKLLALGICEEADKKNEVG